MFASAHIATKNWSIIFNWLFESKPYKNDWNLKKIGKNYKFYETPSSNGIREKFKYHEIKNVWTKTKEKTSSNMKNEMFINTSRKSIYSE